MRVFPTLHLSGRITDFVFTSSVPAPALIKEQADIRAAIMVGSTLSSISGTRSSASLAPISGSPPEQVAASRAAAVLVSIDVPSSPKMA